MPFDPRDFQEFLAKEYGVAYQPTRRPEESSSVTDSMRGLADRIPHNGQDPRLSGSMGLSDMLRGALHSSANWLDRRPEISDMATPTGAMAMGMPWTRAAARPHFGARLDEYGYPEGALRAPKPWTPEFVGPPDPSFRWSPKFPGRDAQTAGAATPSKTTALEEMIARAEGTSRRRNGDLLADSSRASLPGTIVNGLGQAERPVQAAIRVGDKTFQGPTHFDALQAAVPGGHDLWGPELMQAFERTHGTPVFDADGFVTNTGRYVSRKEAGALAEAAGKKPGWLTRLTRTGYDSSDLRAAPSASMPGTVLSSPRPQEPPDLAALLEHYYGQPH